MVNIIRSIKELREEERRRNQPVYTGGKGFKRLDLSKLPQTIVKEDLDFEKAVRNLIRMKFGSGAFPSWRVVPEYKKYRYDKSKEVRDQLAEREPKVCEIYLNDKWLCDVSEKMRPDEVVALISFKMINLQIK